jgi:excisionase family DNA binding protein
MSGNSRKEYLTPHEVASLLLVTTETIRQWAQKGLLNAEVTPGGHRRFLQHEVERFARERGLSLQRPQDDEYRVLIVDDDEQVAAYLLELFQTLPEAVNADVAHDGFNAGHKVFSFRPNVVLLDLMMPGMDGFEVCKQLKNDPSTKAIRIIAMTGYPTPENVEKIVGLGAEACIEKPFSNQALLEAIGIRTERKT